jgi:glycogen debranching enzyme
LRKRVTEHVGKTLLTEVGLRTLPPSDPNYHPHYAGPQCERDEAYHQGTIWPWLLGPYVEAVLRCGAFSDDAKNQARDLLQPLLARLAGPGLGQLHEIHDANETDSTHPPRGCPAQAWSIAEVLRILTLLETTY